MTRAHQQQRQCWLNIIITVVVLAGVGVGLFVPMYTFYLQDAIAIRHGAQQAHCHIDHQFVQEKMIDRHNEAMYLPAFLVHGFLVSDPREVVFQGVAHQQFIQERQWMDKHAKDLLFAMHPVNSTTECYRYKDKIALDAGLHDFEFHLTMTIILGVALWTPAVLVFCIFCVMLLKRVSDRVRARFQPYQELPADYNI